MRIKLPSFLPADEMGFQGYEHSLPCGAQAAEVAKKNLESIGAVDRIAGADVWPLLLQSKLNLMLGAVMEVPLPDANLAFEIHHFGEHFVGPHLFTRSAPGHCHLNSISLWSKNRPKLDLVHGFCARGREWFRHSWCAPRGEKQVIETSQKMDFYHGFRMPDRWARRWARESAEKIERLAKPGAPRIKEFKTVVGTELRLILPPRLAPSPDETSVN